MPLVHHELCFGCGRTNLFGLMLELEPAGPGKATGRCFIKQDHQGPDRGSAHSGVIAAALSEAMALAGGGESRLTSFEIELTGHAAVGAFLLIEVDLAGDGSEAHATATADERLVARARGSYASRG